MEDERVDADPPSLEELDPEQVKDEAAQPGQGQADNPEEVVRKSEPLPSRRNRGKSIGVVMAMLLAGVAALLSGARYIASRESRSHLQNREIPQLAFDNASIRKYLNDLDEAAEEMEDEWEASGWKVRQAFQLHFTPSLGDDEQVFADPFAIILQHADMMQKCKIPPQSSPEARRDFALHVQLLRSICRTVTLRLEELNWFVHMHNTYHLPVPIPDLDGPFTYPELQENEEEQLEDGLAASDFMESVGLFGGDTEPTVSEKLAEILINMLDIGNRQYIYDMMARYRFDPFLQHFGQDAADSIATYRIPYNDNTFRADSFSHAAAYIFRQSDRTPTYDEVRKLHRIAEDWKPKSVVEAAKQQEKINISNFPKRLNIRREQMRRMLKKGIPCDDLLILALFLL